MHQTAHNLFARLVLGCQQNLSSVTKKEKLQKPRESNISLFCQDASTGAISLNVGMRAEIADVSTQAKFCDNRFRY